MRYKISPAGTTVPALFFSNKNNISSIDDFAHFGSETNRLKKFLQFFFSEGMMKARENLALIIFKSDITIMPVQATLP